MIKRIFSLVTLLALVLTAIGLGTAPVTARPSAAGAGSPNAKLLPADTAFYVDIHVADLDKTMTFVLDTVQKVTGFRPGDPYAQMDQGLTQFLGRPATFKKDILSWLGDNITIGLPITDEQLASLNGKPELMGQMFSRPNILAIISVKDDAAAQSFVKELMEKTKSSVQFSSKTDDIAGSQVTIYEQSGGSGCPPNCGSVVLGKGYIAAGLTTAVDNMVASLKAKKPSLADDANFQKLMGALKPNNLLTLYISPRFYKVQMASMQAMMQMSNMSMMGTPEAAATPEATNQMAALSAVFDAIQGQAFGARMDGKVLALDVAQSVNIEAISKVAQQFGLPVDLLKTANQPIEGKLASQISSKALGVVIASGIPNLYTGLQSAAKMMGQMGNQFGGARSGFDPAQIEKGIRQFEAALKLAFDLNVQQDILSWMNGEFALYMLYNPTGTLAKMPNGNSWPFDHTLLIQTSDAAKTKSFLTKLNAGLEKNVKEVTVKPTGDDTYTLTGPNGIGIGYGVSGNTFFVTTQSGLSLTTAAIKGDGTLAGSEAWKRAQATMVKPTSQIWYVDFTQITPLVKAMIDLRSNANANDKQALAALDLLESASISGGVLQPDGLSVASLQITLK